VRNIVRRLGLSAAVIAVSATLFAPQVASAASYIYRPSLVKAVGGVSFTPAGTNPFSPNGLRVAGRSGDQAAVYDLRSKTVTLLGSLVDTVNTSFSYATDVNDLGDAIGVRNVEGGYQGWFLPAGSTKVMAAAADVKVSMIYNNVSLTSINNAKQIVGNESWGSQSFLWDPVSGTSSHLPLLPNSTWLAHAINTAGLIVGSGVDVSGPVLYDSAAQRFIDLPSSLASATVRDVNEKGLVVGTAYDAVRGGYVFSYSVRTKKVKRLAGSYGLDRQMVSKTGIIVGSDWSTKQPLVWKDCAKTRFTALGLPSDEKFGVLYGVDGRGAIWAEYGGQTVRWQRTPRCGT